MARLPRLDLPQIPQHVIQRGNNRQPCFLSEEDYTHYREDLADAATHCGCGIHAYVLMTNHVHLLVAGVKRGAVSRMMQRLGRRYVAYFNAQYRRTGTLWEGRFKSSLVDSERYLLTCYRYIEMNPVRAAMVADPADYHWSSHRCNALGEADRLITPHPLYHALGTDDSPSYSSTAGTAADSASLTRRSLAHSPTIASAQAALREAEASRQSAYRALFKQTLGVDELADIRNHVQQQKALGTTRFQAEIEALLKRRVVVRPRGRPRLEED